MMATLMQALDNTIANVALPHMQGSLGASRDQINWVLTSYVISAAIFTAPVGWLAARFGRKNFFIVCMVGFTVASALCGLAQTLDQIVLFRVLQGAFGAALIPLSQSTILDIYPREQQGTATAIWAMGVMVGPIIGPDAGRISDRSLQLALGVLHQRADRHRRRHRHHPVHARAQAGFLAAVRLVRLRRARRRARLFPARARSRADARLVRFRRDRDRDHSVPASASICSSCTWARRKSRSFRRAFSRIAPLPSASS